MQFEALPILEKMSEFYQQARGRERFEEYLKLMYDKKDDKLKLPLPLFNPMGKDHVPQKLEELRALGADQILDECCKWINPRLTEFSNLPEASFRVTSVLADDLMGGWTNKYSTDYTNTFIPKGMLNRQFVTPIFWTAEEYSIASIKLRILQSLWRTIYHLQNNYPETLLQHLEQEAFVLKQLDFPQAKKDPDEYQMILDFAIKESKNEGRATLISFFYGDPAAESLGYLPLGFEENTGFILAKSLVEDMSE